MKKSAAALVLVCLSLWGYQIRHSQQFEWEMQDAVQDPPDAEVKAEFTFARLRYRSYGSGGGGFGGRRFGRSDRSWGIDANRADRLFSIAMRRLTRVNTKSVEEVIDIDEGPMYDYPWLYAVEVGRWGMNESQAKKMREYFERGGFLMVDDFHGQAEWEIFMDGLRRIFPDRPVVDIPEDHSIFHIISDLNNKVQVPGAHYVYDHVTYEHGGYEPKWRGVFDDKGRIMVAICHNMDLGDAWQYADEPRYPENFASQALRIGVNYVTYSMTH